MQLLIPFASMLGRPPRAGDRVCFLQEFGAFEPSDEATIVAVQCIDGNVEYIVRETNFVSERCDWVPSRFVQVLSRLRP